MGNGGGGVYWTTWDCLYEDQECSGVQWGEGVVDWLEFR